jgi:hypothetical protein
MSLEGVRRTRRVVEHVERTSLGGTGAPRQAVPREPSIVRAKVTTAIPAGSDASPSSTGAAKIRYRDLSGAWVEEAAAVTVYNDHNLSASVAVGKMVKLCWIDGDWWLLQADCP